MTDLGYFSKLLLSNTYSIIILFECIEILAKT